LIALQFRTVFELITILGLSNAAYGAQPTPVELILTPARAEIGIFYGGVEFVVSAEVDPSNELALLVSEPSSDMYLRKKGRIWGLFWAPMEDVVFREIPNLYLLKTSTDINALAPKQILNKLGLGYDALRPPRGEDAASELFEELIRLKESEGLFSFSSDVDVENRPADRHNRTSFTALIPANTPPGTYSVQLFAFRDGELVTHGVGNFELTQSKLVALITSLAQEHGLLYGLIAVLVALSAGLGVGFLFGSSGRH
jgi:uncharacterized protein (TIGR02186 family)